MINTHMLNGCKRPQSKTGCRYPTRQTEIPNENGQDCAPLLTKVAEIPLVI